MKAALPHFKQRQRKPRPPVEAPLPCFEAAAAASPSAGWQGASWQALPLLRGSTLPVEATLALLLQKGQVQQWLPDFRFR